MFSLRESLIALHAMTGALLGGMLWASSAIIPAYAADPVKVGFSMALTGGVAANGKQLLAALEIWRDDVNTKGGLLNRPVELVYYDDQSNPNSVPGIYTKLISVHKVDALLGPYATNMPRKPAFGDERGSQLGESAMMRLPSRSRSFSFTSPSCQSRWFRWRTQST